MTDLRQLLELGAGAPPAAPDLAAVRARGRASQRHRRVLAAAAIAAAVAVPSAALPHLPERLLPSWSTLPPAEPGALPPGEYTAARLTPKIAFAVPDSATSWRVALATASSLVMADDKDGIRISVLHWTAVRPAPSAAVPTPAPSASVPQPAPSALPTDLPAWLAGHPDIRLTRPVQLVHLLGRPAQRVTFEVRADSLTPDGCDCLTLTLADTPDNPFGVGTDQAAEITVMGGELSGLVITLVRPATGTDPDALADANRIVDSITMI